jgi:hypothetical protein
LEVGHERVELLRREFHIRHVAAGFEGIWV